MRAASTSRRSGSICLLSFSPRMGESGERMTAAATTAPNKEPRPTSSAPAMKWKPRARSSCSRFPRHFHLGLCSLRLFAAARAMLSPATGSGTFLKTRGLAFKSPQIVQLRAADLSRAHNIDVIDNRGAQRENTLDAVTEADLADRYGLAHPGVLAREHRAFKHLNAFFFAFFDFDVDFDRVAGTEWRQIGATLLFNKFH